MCGMGFERINITRLKFKRTFGKYFSNQRESLFSAKANDRYAGFPNKGCRREYCSVIV